MQFHQLKPVHKFKKAKRIGRGGKKGWTSGRGAKGQTSRSGHRVQPLIRQIIKRYPKLRGYRAKTVPLNLAVINLERIEKNFAENETVSPQTLSKKGLISGNKIPKVKILGQGELTKALVFEKCLFSKSAKEKIEKVKGSIRVSSS